MKTCFLAILATTVIIIVVNLFNSIDNELDREFKILAGRYGDSISLTSIRELEKNMQIVKEYSYDLIFSKNRVLKELNSRGSNYSLECENELNKRCENNFIAEENLIKKLAGIMEPGNRLYHYIISTPTGSEEGYIIVTGVAKVRHKEITSVWKNIQSN